MRRAWLGTVAANGMLLVGGMTTGILAARLLGPADRGLLAAVVFWPSIFAAVAQWSLGEAIVWRSAQAPERSAVILVSATVLALTAALATSIVAVPLLPRLLGEARSEVLDLAVLFACVWLPVTNLNVVLMGADQAARRFGRLNLLRLGPNGFYLAGILALWAMGRVSVETLAWAMAGGSALTLVLRLATARRDLVAAPERSEIATLARVGSRFHAGALAALLSSQADRLVLVLAFPDVTIGHYVVAWTFAASGLAAVTNAVPLVLLPHLAAERDRERARALLALALRRTAIFLYAGVPIAGLATPWLFPLLFGAAYVEAVPLALLLLVAVVPLTLRQTILRCLRAFGEARIAVVNELAAMVALFCTAIVAVGTIGRRVEAIATAVVLANLVGLFHCIRHLDGRHAISPIQWIVPGIESVRDLTVLTTNVVRFRRPFTSHDTGFVDGSNT